MTSVSQFCSEENLISSTFFCGQSIGFLQLKCSVCSSHWDPQCSIHSFLLMLYLKSLLVLVFLRSINTHVNSEKKRQWKMVSLAMLFPGWLTEFLIFFAMLLLAPVIILSLSISLKYEYLSPKMLQAKLDSLPDKSYPFQIVLRSIYLMISFWDVWNLILPVSSAWVECLIQVALCTLLVCSETIHKNWIDQVILQQNGPFV